MEVMNVTPEKFIKIMWNFGLLVLLIILMIQLPAIIEAVKK